MPNWNAEAKTWEWTDAELEAEVEAGARRTAELREKTPRRNITSARYLPAERRVLVDLDNGTTFIFPADQVQGLAGKTDEELAALEILSYDTLAWPALDAIAPVSDLMAGIFGSKAWMKRLSEMGKKGGAARSQAKAEAARENGRRGGRPRKTAL